MKIAVTAATGRLGRATLAAVLEHVDAADVVAIARDPVRIELPDVDVRRGDYASREQMTTALDGIDTVVMISAPVTEGTDRAKLHRNVIAAAVDAGVRRLIYTSVIGAPEARQTRFAAFQALNRQTEQDLEASGLDWIVARNGLYLDLDLGHILRANDTGVYCNNGGAGRCGYISIAELGFALAALATGEHGNGRILNLTSENRTQAELVALANEVFDLDVRFEPISPEQNIDKFLADDKIAARGRGVVEMLTGCFECIACGAFDVESHFAAAAGRPPKSIREQFADIRDRG